MFVTENSHALFLPAFGQIVHFYAYTNRPTLLARLRLTVIIQNFPSQKKGIHPAFWYKAPMSNAHCKTSSIFDDCQFKEEYFHNIIVNKNPPHRYNGKGYSDWVAILYILLTKTLSHHFSDITAA